jgi:hypothetical protein
MEVNQQRRGALRQFFGQEQRTDFNGTRLPGGRSSLTRGWGRVCSTIGEGF